jgi:hypothetical protein
MRGNIAVTFKFVRVFFLATSRQSGHGILYCMSTESVIIHLPPRPDPRDLDPEPGGRAAHLPPSPQRERIDAVAA